MTSAAYRKESAGFPVPVILGGSVNGLGLVRALAMGGHRSLVVGSHRDIASYSRYAEHIFLPCPVASPELFSASLLSFARSLPFGGIVFATGDDYLKAIWPVRERLDKAGLMIPMADTATMEIFGSKSRTRDLARELGVSVPKALTILGKDLATANREIGYPAILKPDETVGFVQAFALGRQTVVLQDPAESAAFSTRIVEAGWEDRRFVLQEFIPGPSTALFTISSFSDRSGEILAYSTGHKIRQHPPEAGTICLGRVVPRPELVAPAEKLFRATGFHGIANTEFKYDSRTDDYKLIEVNPRPGKWNYSATMTGVNLPLIAYDYYVQNLRPEKRIFSNREAIWNAGLHTLFSFVAERGGVGGLRQMLRIRAADDPRVIPAVFSLNDPLPAMMQVVEMFTLTSARIVRTIRGRN